RARHDAPRRRAAAGHRATLSASGFLVPGRLGLQRQALLDLLANLAKIPLRHLLAVVRRSKGVTPLLVGQRAHPPRSPAHIRWRDRLQQLLMPPAVVELDLVSLHALDEAALLEAVEP